LSTQGWPQWVRSFFDLFSTPQNGSYDPGTFPNSCAEKKRLFVILQVEKYARIQSH
jgi:hypothetical protein